MNKETIKKQTKIINKLKRLPAYKLKLFSSDNKDLKNLTKSDYKIIMDCCWVDMGKTEGTQNEIQESIGGVMVLCTLEYLRRKGLVYINKEGNYQKISNSQTSREENR